MPTEKRFVVVEGSQSDHDCCFDATVVDTAKPLKFSKGESVCECASRENAERIAELLNNDPHNTPETP